MAKKDDSQPSRLYKASDVHKRRVGKKAPAPSSAPAPTEGSAREEAFQVAESVVLTPQFGGRTEQQKAADDRWFAAMREGPAAPAEPPAPEATITAPLPPVAENAETADVQPGQEDVPVGVPPVRPPDRESQAGQENPQSDAPTRRPTVAKAVKALRPAKSATDQPATDQPDQPDQPAKRMSLRKRIALIVAIVVVVALAVAVALFTWNRWYRFDDAADLQGEWYVVGTTTPVTIGEDTIKLTDDVTYHYEIDPQDKTIRYTFGPMAGQGRYWFSDDRQYLVITDGDDYTSTGTAIDDLLHEFSDLTDRAGGAQIQLPEGEGIIAFSREPDAAALAREQREAAEKAAAEEAARQEAERLAAEQAAAEAAEAAAYAEYYYYEEPDGEEPAEEAEAPAEEPPAEEPPAEEG